MSYEGIDLSNYPAMQPPAGQHSNFVDPPSVENKLLIINCVFTSLMAVMIVIRLVIKGPITKVLWWDDYTCFAAAICSIIHAVVMMEQCEQIGYGKHMWDIPASKLVDKDNLRLLSANNIVYIVCIFLAKVSMLLLYLRIFPKRTRLGKWIVWMMVFLGLFTAAMLGTAIASEFKCITVGAQTTSLCHNISTNLIIFQAAVTVATDFYVLVLPIPPLFRTLVQSKRKLLIALIFLTGLV
ncbi:hypothetical protein SLS55_005021 [Diplodia seriata]|uniref:Rhodopsin domain-containing protein n=1 Tax=Diplodia seriata TaxID=420778 RepID=A0ABR3CF65_9PEZI